MHLLEENKTAPNDNKREKANVVSLKYIKANQLFLMGKKKERSYLWCHSRDTNRVLEE